MKILESDLEIIKYLLRKYMVLSTISFDNLDAFEERMEKRGRDIKFGSVRTRFRNACNKAYELGLCKKEYIGTTAYQTSDTLGGKSCICYSIV